jgi:hypothetical protein
LLAAACGHAPPPAAKEVERPARSVAEIAGMWVTSDDMDWGYNMTISPKGTIDVWIDRGKMGRCQQKGSIAAGKTEGQFRLVYKIGQCEPRAVNVPIDATITQLSTHLTIIVGSDHRVYERAPEQKDDDKEQPAALLKH